MNRTITGGTAVPRHDGPGRFLAGPRMSRRHGNAGRQGRRGLLSSLSEPQRKVMCHDWDKKGYGKYPLRLHVTNNWAVSSMAIGSLTKEQQAIVDGYFQERPAAGLAREAAPAGQGRHRQRLNAGSQDRHLRHAGQRPVPVRHFRLSPDLPGRQG